MAEEINTEHEQGILEVIATKPVYCFKDIFVYYKACSRPTAYNHNLDKLDSIKEAIYNNKRKGFVSLIDKWMQGDNPTLQIAAMRLICDDDEHRRLNQQFIDHSNRGDKFENLPPIVLNIKNDD